MRKLTLIFFLGLAMIIANLALAQKLPDLDLENVRCYKGFLDFTVINRGGPLPSGWKAVANVYFDGVKQGHIDLSAPTSTTGGGIDSTNGTSRYLTSFKITKPVVVDIFIDATNEIKESNEANNYRKGARIRPCDSTAIQPSIYTIQTITKPELTLKLPDLTVKDITVDKKCFVHVLVANNGPGVVPNSVWDLPHQPDDSSVYLYRGGTGWGGITIWKLDPAKSLKTAGGTAVYNSTLQISGLESITATIDHTNKVKETNEANNKLTKRLECKTETPGQPGTERKARWRITYLTSSPICYNPPPPNGPDFLYKLKFEFKAQPASLPAGDLVISGKYQSNIEANSVPAFNVSAYTAGWSNGESHDFMWATVSEPFNLTKVNDKHFILKKDDNHIGPHVAGPVYIHITAESVESGITYFNEVKTLTIKPCQPTLTHVPVK